MTINEAIAHAMKVAEQNDAQAEKWREEGGEEWGKTTTCRECAADHRQLAKWLIELKDLREENKVLISECDRLIKEKGELLSKVSGGDVLRICQLEERLQVELDNSHCLEIELAEAKRLLKAAVEDFAKFDRENAKNKNCMMPEMDCADCPLSWDSVDDRVEPCHSWRCANEAKKLINDEK
jgi:hypothetical protein